MTSILQGINVFSHFLGRRNQLKHCLKTLQEKQKCHFRMTSAFSRISACLNIQSLSLLPEFGEKLENEDGNLTSIDVRNF